jgi:putative hemolysin
MTRDIRRTLAQSNPRLKPLASDAVVTPFAFFAEKLVGLGPWNKALRESMADPNLNTHNPFETFLSHFGTPAVLPEGELEKIPVKGPLIMYGLHPTGPLEVMGMMSLALKRRPDVKVVALKELEYFGNLKDYFLGVDMLSPEPIRSQNNKKLRDAIKEHLKQGGAIIIFPGGHPSLRVDGKLWEPTFNPSTAKYGIEFNATMLPFMMSNRVSELYYKGPTWLRCSGMWRFSQCLRADGKLSFNLGDPIDVAKYKSETNATATDFTAVGKFNELLRSKVDLLAPDYHPGSFLPPSIERAQKRQKEPIGQK